MVSPVSEYVPVRRVVQDALSLMPRPRSAEILTPSDAYARVSAEEIRTQTDIPLRPVSRMDGFAIRSIDARTATEKRPARLKIVGEVKIGEVPTGRVAAGEAWRISTGAFLPDGADAVAPIEEVVIKGPRIGLPRTYEGETNLFRAGEDMRKGSLVIGKGSRFRAQDVSLTVSLGIRTVKVFPRPRVAVLATGSELTNEPGGEPGKTSNSHGPFFELLARSAGCETVSLGIARDRTKEILDKIRKGLRSANIVLTTGGTSVGSFDLVEDVVRKLKPSLLYHGIRMDRGRVAGLAVVGRKPIVMMPGPIQGALNAFVLLALPMIQKVSGGGEQTLRVRAKLTRRWEARKRFPNFTKIVYLRLLSGRGGLAAEPMVAETESMSLIARSNAIAIVPEDVLSMEAGLEIEAILLPGLSFAP